MAGLYEGAVQDLIDELGRLPGVGPKSAQRIAFYLLEADSEDVRALIDALTAVKEKVRYCAICGNVTEAEICAICADPRRTNAVICVVEESRDIVAIERTHEYRGKYHVLGGAIDPIGGIGPEQLRIRELYARLQSGEVKEVILATDPNIEGEATATYLALNLAHMGVTVSRLASGLPVGGDLEYADEITLSRALAGRQQLSAPNTPNAPSAPSAPNTPNTPSAPSTAGSANTSAPINPAAAITPAPLNSDAGINPSTR